MSVITTQAPSQATSTGSGVQVTETTAWSLPGFVAVAVSAGCAVAGVGAIALASTTESDATAGLAGVAAALVFLLMAVVLSSLVIVQPGQTRVIQFFGRYVGTVRRPGMSWVMPLTLRFSVSVRVRNFETNHLKVNDADGNPVEIAAIVVWQVADTAKARYAVDDYEDFVNVQSESALRHVAVTHPYDDPTGEGTSLRGSTDLVADELAFEVAQRVGIAGVSIVEVRISHLAYSPEIAQAMLRRQQASAIVAARTRIVEGAVGMVELALARLSEGGIIELDEERKAAMVSNLMVVLCGDHQVTPIVNTGTLYS